MDDSTIDPIPPALQPLLMAVGRAVVGAAALEKVMLVDIARRRAMGEGFTDELGTELATLERKTAGQLLIRLKQLGLDEPIAERIGKFIARRNEIVHHFMERPDVIKAFMTGDATELVADLEQIAVVSTDCEPDCAAHVRSRRAAVRRSLESLVESIQAIDVDTVDDEELRRQVELAQMLTAERLAELRGGDEVDPARR